MGTHYDVIVIGAGHAGCEAALAAARMECKVLLLTMNMDAVALMPCNPAIGGPAKAHLVREIDALGGEMGRNINATMIQVRMLNTNKGAAVHSLRAQADKVGYQQRMKLVLENQPNLWIRQAVVEGVETCAQGLRVLTNAGTVFSAGNVVITTGTYMSSRIIIGGQAWSGGPNAQSGPAKISDSLKNSVWTWFVLKQGHLPGLMETVLILKRWSPSQEMTLTLAFHIGQNQKTPIASSVG